MNKDLDRFSDLLETRKSTRDHLKIKGDVWRFDEESYKEFDTFFEELLNGRSIIDIAKAIKATKGKLHALNILGGGQVLRDIKADQGIAMRLEAPKDPNGITYISGDLLKPNIWKKIPNEQDLILSMGRGGLYGLTGDRDVLYYLINSAWNKMSSDGGIGFFQIPSFIKDDFLPWIEKVSQTSGIRTRWMLKKANDGDTYYAVLLAKVEDSPKNLPTI